MAGPFEFLSILKRIITLTTLDRDITNLVRGLLLSHSKAQLASLEHLPRQPLIPIDLELPECIVRRIKHCLQLPFHRRMFTEFQQQLRVVNSCDCIRRSDLDRLIEMPPGPFDSTT